MDEKPQIGLYSSLFFVETWQSNIPTNGVRKTEGKNNNSKGGEVDSALTRKLPPALISNE